MTKDPREGLEHDGTIRTGVDALNIRSPYSQVIDAVRHAFEGIDASIYVYGSVATGQARTPESDVDVLVVSEDAAARTRATEASWNLSERFSDIAREVAILTVTPGEVFEDTRSGLASRAFIKHYCVCVAGLDLATEIQPTIVSDDLAIGFAGQFAADTLRCLGEASMTDSHNVITKKTVEAARRVLLGLAPLVSVRHDTWTTDREDAVRLASELKPELTDRLQHVMDIVKTGMVDDTDEAKLAINGILEWAQTDLLDS